jgi:hypothetical protein
VRARLAGLLERCLGPWGLPPKAPRPRRAAIAPRGRHFHLGEIFDRINRDCFDGEVTAAITWGRRSARGPRRSIRLGSYRREKNLIRIHPALDAAFVPSCVVEALVHHEMLHEVIPVRIGENGRRVVHGRDFRARERRFRGFRRAEMWRRENIELLLRPGRSFSAGGGSP